MSDVEIDTFLKELGYFSWIFEVEKYLTPFFAKDSPRLDVLVNKFRFREDDLPTETAIRLSKSLSVHSDRFPASHPDDLVVGGGTRHQIARLLMHLAKSLESTERSTLLLEIAKKTPDILFAFDFAVMMRAFGETIETFEKGAWVIVCNGIERDVNKTVVERIAEWAEKEPLEDLNFGWAQELYIFWFHNDATSLGAYYQTCLEENILSFLRSVGGMARFDTTGSKNFTYSMSRHLPWFNMLTTLIDVEKAALAIDKAFPNVQEEENPTDRHKQVAKVFLDAYRKPPAETSNYTDPIDDSD